MSEAPLHCDTKDDIRYEYVLAEKLAVFRPDEAGRATQFRVLADRVDYLESFCAGINAYRDEE